MFKNSLRLFLFFGKSINHLIAYIILLDRVHFVSLTKCYSNKMYFSQSAQKTALFFVQLVKHTKRIYNKKAEKNGTNYKKSAPFVENL